MPPTVAALAGGRTSASSAHAGVRVSPAPAGCSSEARSSPIDASSSLHVSSDAKRGDECVAATQLFDMLLRDEPARGNFEEAHARHLGGSLPGGSQRSSAASAANPMSGGQLRLAGAMHNVFETPHRSEGVVGGGASLPPQRRDARDLKARACRF